MLTAFRLAAFYDRLRLSVYQARGAHTQRISIADMGASTLLRFDDVGYFNIVYSSENDVGGQLDAIERFFVDSPHGCRLISPSLQDAGPLADACDRRGWVADERLVWLSGASVMPAIVSGPIEVRRACPHEATTFFHTYLTAFEAPPEKVPSAIDNMRHLFEEPKLHFLLATHAGQPVGVGMLLHHGADALFCAGAMIPSHRGQGGHDALLAARVALAHDLGCTAMHSWARCGGTSAVNMTRAGFRIVGTTRSWRFSSREHE